MSEVSDRFRRVAQGFTARATEVPPEGWERPAPCEGWSARDVVAHLVETTAMFLGQAGLDGPAGPSAAEDPVAAWFTARDVVQAVLDDPELADRPVETAMGSMTLAELIGRFGVGDVLVHTWDLARATGLDERLDPEEVRRLYEMMAPNDALMRQGTAFGPRVEVPDDADEQTRLIAFTGRQP